MIIMRPIILVSVPRRHTGIELLGIKFKTSLIASPIGVQRIMDHESEETTARACRDVDMPIILSVSTTMTIEKMAELSGDGDQWF
jgi:isopentenyl diphosphate isomerase/L-lactate dehydrogenase-like FMN-dependent dehydrogenase